MNVAIKYTVLLILLLVLILIPEAMIMRSDFHLCIFKMATGHECPLCGMTSGAFEMIHFRMLPAFGFNPLIIFLPLLLAVEILYDATHNSIIRRIRKVVFFIFIAGLLVLGIARWM